MPGPGGKQLEVEIIEIADAGRRPAVRVGHTGHARQRFEPPLKLVVKGRDASRLLILRVGQLDRRGQQVGAVEAKIDPAQLAQAGEQQRRHDQQRRGDRELAADERRAKTAHREAAGGRPRRRAEHGVDAAGAVHRRNEPEEQRARGGDGGEYRESRAIKCQFVRPRQIVGAGGVQHLDSRPGDRGAERRRGRCEQKALASRFDWEIHEILAPSKGVFLGACFAPPALTRPCHGH